MVIWAMCLGPCHYGSKITQQDNIQEAKKICRSAQGKNEKEKELDGRRRTTTIEMVGK